MRGDAPEDGVKGEQHDAAGLGPEEAANTIANGETSPMGSGIDPGEHHTLEDGDEDLYDEIEHSEVASLPGVNGGSEARTDGPGGVPNQAS